MQILNQMPCQIPNGIYHKNRNNIPKIFVESQKTLSN